MLVGERKNSDDAFNGLRGVNGVQRGKHQVAGLGCFQRNFNGFTVTHLANQNNFWRLPQRGPQRHRKRRRVAVQFTLMDYAILMRVQKFDRIFNGENMKRLLLVNEINDRRKRRRLAGTGRSGHQHDSIAESGYVPQFLGQIEFGKARDIRWNNAHNHSAASPLHENVYAEPR